MHPTVLNRMLAALSKRGAELAVSVAPSAHASIEGGNEKFYRLAHFNANAGLAWIVNPVTNHVCKVVEADLLGWRYDKEGQAQNASAVPAEPLYVVFTEAGQPITNKDEALEIATAYAKAQRGKEFYVGQSVVSVVVPSEPKPEITQY